MEATENTALSNGSAPIGSLTATEQRVARIWRTTLQVESFGADDNFFALGGDSMMMMRVLLGVREEFGVELDQSLLLQLPTLRQFGEMVDSATPIAASDAASVDGVI